MSYSNVRSYCGSFPDLLLLLLFLFFFINTYSNVSLKTLNTIYPLMTPKCTTPAQCSFVFQAWKGKSSPWKNNTQFKINSPKAKILIFLPKHPPALIFFIILVHGNSDFAVVQPKALQSSWIPLFLPVTKSKSISKSFGSIFKIIQKYTISHDHYCYNLVQAINILIWMIA